MDNKIRRPYKDERDQEIQIKSENHVLEFVVVTTQILTIICLFKGNPAWKGSRPSTLLEQLHSFFISIISMKKNLTFMLELSV